MSSEPTVFWVEGKIDPESSLHLMSGKRTGHDERAIDGGRLVQVKPHNGTSRMIHADNLWDDAGDAKAQAAGWLINAAAKLNAQARQFK